MDAAALSPLPTPARSDSHVPQVPQVPQVPPRRGSKGMQTAPRSRTAAPVSTRNPSSTPSSPVPFTLPEFQFEAKHGRHRARAAADPLARVGGSRTAAPRSIFADNDDDLGSVLEESSMLGSVVRAAQRAGDDGPWPTATASLRSRPMASAAASPVFRPAASPPVRPVDRGMLGSSPLARGNALAPPKRRDDELSAMSADTAYGSLLVTPNGGLDARAGRNAVPLILEPESEPEPATLYHPLADDANADYASRAISLALPPSSTLGRSYSGRTGVISLALPASSTLGRPAAPPPPLPRTAAAAADLSRATSRSTIPTTVIDSTLPRTVLDGTTRPPTMATTQATSTLPRTLLDSTLPRSSVLGPPPALPARYLEEVEMRPPPAAIPGMPGSMRLEGYDAQDSALGVDDVPVPARNWYNTAPGSPRPSAATRAPVSGPRVIVPPPRTAAVPVPIPPPPRAVVPSRPGEYGAAARRPVGSPRVPDLGSPQMLAPVGPNVIPRDGPMPAVLRSAVPIVHAKPRVVSPPPRAASPNAPHAFRRILIMAAGVTVVAAIVVVVLVLFVH